MIEVRTIATFKRYIDGKRTYNSNIQEHLDRQIKKQGCGPHVGSLNWHHGRTDMVG